MKNVGTTIFLAAILLMGRSLAADERGVDFGREVLPILSDKCFVCHGPDGEARETLRLDSYDAATRLLESGERAIDPDALKQSSILTRIHSKSEAMPPADAEKQLTDREREILTEWVQSGGQYELHWAFTPPQRSAELKGTAAIDTFVAENLKSAGLTFAPRASRARLARRASLVLTGLPPEPAALAKFLADESDHAYEHFVDALLASDRYGEHQARYWLDAVRYGDTHGLHLDNRRAIFSYRDWVVHAFNRNLPLDEFLTWQLAGDLLPNPSLEQTVATGFVRMNPTTSEGGVIAAEFQAKNNFDRVETLGTVLLGMTLTCARCHSHKYDPVSQEEYYRLFAFFNSSAESPLDGNKYEYGPVVKAPASVAAWTTWNALESAAQELFTKSADAIAQLPPDMRKKFQAGATRDRLLILANEQGPLANAAQRGKATELANAMEKASAQFTTTLVTQELPQPRETKLLARGEYDLPQGDPLSPGSVAVMGPYPADAPANRLGLAKWLTSREHPLVARVLINRVWQRTFGEGLVRTPEDFGLQGEQPTHPELLDWLAVELHDSGWDLKHMLRLMVTSRTFQQDSAWRNGVEDPTNRLLARGPRFRLDAEVLRDIGLWASGLLSDESGGEGIKPYQPAGMWEALMHPASNTKSYVRDQGGRLYRRSLYVYWKRTSPHPMLTLFDAPSREASCVRRSRTNTPMQSLGLFNETQRMEMSRNLAARLLQEQQTDDTRMNLLFTLLASRPAAPAERAACISLLSAMRKRYQEDPAAAKAVLSHGDAPRNKALDPVEHAAWTQLAVTVLASDVAILVY